MQKNDWVQICKSFFVLNSTAHFLSHSRLHFQGLFPIKIWHVPCSIPKLQHVPIETCHLRWHKRVTNSPVLSFLIKFSGFGSRLQSLSDGTKRSKTMGNFGWKKWGYGVLQYSTQFQTCPCSLDCRENLETMKYRSFHHFSAGRNACKFRFYPSSPFWILGLHPIALSFLSNSCQNK